MLNCEVKVHIYTQVRPPLLFEVSQYFHFSLTMVNSFFAGLFHPRSFLYLEIDNL